MLQLIRDMLAIPHALREIQIELRHQDRKLESALTLIENVELLLCDLRSETGLDPALKIDAAATRQILTAFDPLGV